MNSTAKQVGQSAQDLAQKIAQQMAREPLEIFKDVKEQTTGVELSGQPGGVSQPEGSSQQNRALEQQTEIQDKMKAERRMEALQREIDDIRKQDLFKDLQKRISESETIPLEDYPELSLEQKQVLNAQMEAVKNQMARQRSANQFSEVPGVHSKPSRRFGAGQKHEAEKQQTRVEKPVPPSQ